jgi:hypothetical protein
LSGSTFFEDREEQEYRRNIVIGISYFILASLLKCNLKVGGSVLKDEPSFDLQYAATLHVGEFVTALQTKECFARYFLHVWHNFSWS